MTHRVHLVHRTKISDAILYLSANVYSSMTLLNKQHFKTMSIIHLPPMNIARFIYIIYLCTSQNQTDSSVLCST